MRALLFLFLLGSLAVATDAMAEEKNAFSRAGKARLEVEVVPESESDQKMNELDKKIYEINMKRTRSLDSEMSPRVEIYQAAKNSAVKRESQEE